MNEKEFENLMRQSIMDKARLLSKSKFQFSTFEKSFCNETFWNRTEKGGFRLKPDASPDEAIRDIFLHGEKYGTDCSTAIVILYYGALLDIFSKELYDKVFKNIYLYSWYYVDSDLGIHARNMDSGYTPGDCRYFRNPDYNKETPEWQGENTIDMGGDQYYGHDLGIKTSVEMIAELNEHRKTDARLSAYLTDTVANPDYRHLYDLYKNN